MRDTFYCNKMSYKVDELVSLNMNGMVCLINQETNTKIFVQPERIDGLSLHIYKNHTILRSIIE